MRNAIYSIHRLGRCATVGTRTNAGIVAKVSLRLLALGALSLASLAHAETSTLQCATSQGRVQTTLCSTESFKSLDKKLVDVFEKAKAKAGVKGAAKLEDGQRAWSKRREECANSEDVNNCLLARYQHRIVTLQVRQGLVPVFATARYACPVEGKEQIVEARYFQTDPQSLLAKRGSEDILMFVQPSGSGARYAGPRGTLWEHGQEARISWGEKAPEVTCKKVGVVQGGK